jgi:hypothetical protein
MEYPLLALMPFAGGEEQLQARKEHLGTQELSDSKHMQLTVQSVPRRATASTASKGKEHRQELSDAKQI